MNLQTILTEMKNLGYSLLGAMATAAALAGLHWLTTEIPIAVQTLTMAAGSYAAVKVGP